MSKPQLKTLNQIPMPLLKQRKNNRMIGYDYSRDGMYFITICTKYREHYFGEIRDGEMILNEYGEIIRQCWLDLPNHYANCVLDEFVIMPNHFHGIVVIDNGLVRDVSNVSDIPDVSVGTGLKPVPTTNTKNTKNTKNTTNIVNTVNTQNIKTHGLSEIVRGFKTFSSRRINEINHGDLFQWQRSFWDNIIGNEQALCDISQYIINNPKKWKEDRFFEK